MASFSSPFLLLLLLLLLLLSFFATTSSLSSALNSGKTATRRRRRGPLHRHPLSLEFYSKSCPHLDKVVASVTSQQFKHAPVSAPATIRLFFHDCFVDGCDGSVLIEKGHGGRLVVERDMWENRHLGEEAFETVRNAKAAVEKHCPGIVSCADILAVATRDFVRLAGGPYYEVKKGRRDGKVSRGYKVKYNLPGSNSTMDELINLFAKKGLSTEDLVALSGAHTIGFTHCDQFVHRLYDFRGTERADPSMNPRLLKALSMYCPAFGGNTDVVTPFDVRTPFLFDHMYYGNLQEKMGILATDQALFLDSRTRPHVRAMGNSKAKFFRAFVAGMEKMGSIGVKRGRKGEVRRECSKHNLHRSMF